MKESDFIRQNKEKWQDFENNLLKKDADPSKTSKLFIQITDDLSYARTFYQNRSVRLYLNGNAKLLFNDLNKSRKKGFSAFLNFWKEELPLTLFNARRAMLISFLVFIACFTLGVVTSIHDPEFASNILSSSYVQMTEANIKKGDAMAVYKSDGELETFLPILYNNLKVDMLTFFSGIFMAIGSLVIMIANGVMVGVFQYFFIERGLFWESFLGIWTHGALEIPTIILSGGAGLTLGKGLLFPGTLTRFQAFRLSGMNGLKIIMGVAPVTLLAAFIEGFITRHTDIPNPIRFAFILMSFALILSYFFYYPRRVAKRRQGQTGEEKDHTLVYKPEVEFDPAEIYPTKKIITETFRLLFSNFAYFGRYLFPAAILCAVLVAYNPLNLFQSPEHFSFAMKDFFNYEEFPFLGILAGLFAIGLTFASLQFLKKTLLRKREEDAGISRLNYLIRTGFTIFISVLVYAAIIFTSIDFTLVLAHVLLPFLVVVICTSCYQDLGFFPALRYATHLVSVSWTRFIFSSLIFTVLSLILYSTSTYGLSVLFIKDALAWMLTNDELVASQIGVGVMAFQSFLSLFLYLLLLLISNSLLFFTLKEARTAEHLIARIKNISILK